ncbi:hypothetical protein Pmar_PMAR010305 [Perkinsus marinus ATCC 50983]|uniref:Uncharacterized protein n=1 Tax=Perkinsus marinus (strain ATCC 50983 / TXsc) TaxID=423536 RepID=C5K5D6_PERM5|nr:hypothetical protein Pmar_PMAR010305 [Perkinsus marinus ATCC 50983]EER20558.1 hypothetical protein Pmar_PMAR010305 [Perkinsus marinus ATCC 50983]|eukprot:XP_002788762.1 hypothetical protein Pmar_PMAR010305 [Perkinsus marinus ATCC 50983]
MTTISDLSAQLHPQSSVTDALHLLSTDSELTELVLRNSFAATVHTLEDIHLLGGPSYESLFGISSDDCAPALKLVVRKLIRIASALHTSSGAAPPATTPLPEQDTPWLDSLSHLLTLTPSSGRIKLQAPTLAELLGDRDSLRGLTYSLHCPPDILLDIMSFQDVDRLRVLFSKPLRSYCSLDKGSTYADNSLKLSTLIHCLLVWACTTHLTGNIGLGFLLSHCDNTISSMGDTIQGKVVNTQCCELYHTFLLKDVHTKLGNSVSVDDICDFISSSSSNTWGIAVNKSTPHYARSANTPQRRRADSLPAKQPVQTRTFTWGDSQGTSAASPSSRAAKRNKPTPA